MLKKILLVLVLVSMVTICVGCKKEEPAPQDMTITDMQKQAGEAAEQAGTEADAAKKEAGKQLEDAGKALQK
jgi:hypothetical protein